MVRIPEEELVGKNSGRCRLEQRDGDMDSNSFFFLLFFTLTFLLRNHRSLLLMTILPSRQPMSLGWACKGASGFHL